MGNRQAAAPAIAETARASAAAVLMAHPPSDGERLPHDCIIGSRKEIQRRATSSVRQIRCVISNRRLPCCSTAT